MGKSLKKKTRPGDRIIVKEAGAFVHIATVQEKGSVKVVRAGKGKQ